MLRRISTHYVFLNTFSSTEVIKTQSYKSSNILRVLYKSGVIIIYPSHMVLCSFHSYKTFGHFKYFYKLIMLRLLYLINLWIYYKKNSFYFLYFFFKLRKKFDFTIYIFITFYKFDFHTILLYSLMYLKYVSYNKYVF